ncbi:MAG: alcohol dehydrogenase catalytic domain-containing protein [Acidimicrobiia bacterium]|nr:alcohol dehydrogenase catalytic domain-containing protein [Acidimicrobiia bacterium]
MKAVLFPGDSHTEIRDIEIPEPGPGEVVVRLTASGVCGTDVHYWHESAESRGDRAGVVPGHESVGVVHAVGPGVTRFEEGHRVVAGMLHIGCGHCKVCRRGEFALCGNKQVFGRTLGGSYAEYVKAPTQAVYRLADDLPDDVAVLAACNLSTAYSALRRADVRRGESLTVFGLGGVGLCTVLIAAEEGVEVVAVDPLAERRAKATALGAAAVLDPEELGAMIARDGFGTDVAIECSGHPAAQKQSIDVLVPGGRTVVVGMGGGYNFIAEEIIGKKATLMGTLVCRPDEFYDVLEFAGGHVDELRTLLGPRITIDSVDEGLRHSQDGGEGKVLFDWTVGKSS